MKIKVHLSDEEKILAARYKTKERHLLALTCIWQGKPKTKDLTVAVGKSNRIVTEICKQLLVDGLIENPTGPNGGGLAGGKRITILGKKVLYDNGNHNINFD